MIELYQFAWSPYCLPMHAVLEYSGARFKLVDVPPQERMAVWKLTKGRYYGVPIVRDGKKVIFEDDHVDSQNVARYLDKKLKLDLFPEDLDGVQSILLRHIEDEIEGSTFRLNDVYYRENIRGAKLGAAHELQYLRFKERKFGRGCIDQWRAQARTWLTKLAADLAPYEQALENHPFLLGEKPHYADFCLFGMLENMLYSGKYQLPKSLTNIRQWHKRMKTIRVSR